MLDVTRNLNGRQEDAVDHHRILDLVRTSHPFEDEERLSLEEVSHIIRQREQLPSPEAAMPNTMPRRRPDQVISVAPPRVPAVSTSFTQPVIVDSVTRKRAESEKNNDTTTVNQLAKRRRFGHSSSESTEE